MSAIAAWWRHRAIGRSLKQGAGAWAVRLLAPVMR
jgi:hypothetical protein